MPYQIRPYKVIHLNYYNYTTLVFPKFKILAAITNFCITTSSQNKNITFYKNE
jgi:hypothetical protein